MDGPEYNYDVAFSFLAEDETLAEQLNDLLQGRLTTFLYSKRQGELAGTDGEQSFNAVFSEQARLVVVVLYRPRWGQTPWTRIEETAIRNRAYDEGYDFVKFIPLEEPATVPKWLPRTQLWIGLPRWGLAGAASVIEARVQELGGEPQEESATDRALRLDRTINFAQRRKEFLESVAGVEAACKEFLALCCEVQGLTQSINESVSSISLNTKRADRQVVVLGLSFALNVVWCGTYRNSLDGAKLNVEIWNGHPPFPEIMHFEKPKRLQTWTFTFDLLPSDTPCWASDERTFDTKHLTEHILKLLGFCRLARAQSGFEVVADSGASS